MRRRGTVSGSRGSRRPSGSSTANSRPSAYRPRAYPCDAKMKGCLRKADFHTQFEKNGRRFFGNICWACWMQLDPPLGGWDGAIPGGEGRGRKATAAEPD